MKNALRRGFLLLVAVSIFVWFTRPLWHPFFFFFYVNPVTVELIILGNVIIGVLVVYRRNRVRRLRGLEERGELKLGEFRRRKGELGKNVDRAFRVMAALFLVALLVGLFLSSAFSQVHISKKLEVEGIDRLPEAEADKPRALPLSVAEKYASDSLQYPRYRVTSSDITMLNGTPTWSFVLSPDGLVNYFILKGRGAMFVDMTETGKNTEIIEDRLAVAPGQGILDNSRWRLLKERYWVGYEDPYAVNHDGKIYVAVPLVEFGHHFRFPVVYAVPEWGGTALIAPDGEILFLTPEEAAVNPVLKGQKLFPFDLSRYYVNSFRYKNGIVNKLFYHREELEVTPLPGYRNDQPFTVITEEGIKYFVAVEPYGNAHGIYQIWVIGGRSGEFQRYQIPLQDGLWGPNRAAQYVKQEDRQTYWDQFSPSEPVPLVKDGELYWQIRVIPKDSSGVAYTAIVNPKTSDVVELETDEDIAAYLQNEGTFEVRERDNESGTVMVIMVYEDDELVKRINISTGEEIKIITPSIK